MGASPLAMTTFPVRTASMISNAESMLMAASIFAGSPVMMAVMATGVRSTDLPPKWSMIWSASVRLELLTRNLMRSISLTMASLVVCS